MKKVYYLTIMISILGIALSGCVAKDPKHPIVMQEVRDGLQEEFSEEAAMIKNMLIFETTLKVYMIDEFPAEKLTPFAKKITSLFGFSMRQNKKLFQVYNVSIFQNKMYENKLQLKQIADCTFENGSDRVKVKDLGLGEGKYDVYQ